MCSSMGVWVEGDLFIWCFFFLFVCFVEYDYLFFM